MRHEDLQAGWADETMEHGISLPGKEGEDRLIQAYVESDDF